MSAPEPFIDIHCHLIPAIDDGSQSWEDTLEMADMAAQDGIGAIVCTPHQLGNYAHNHGDMIRERTYELQRVLDEHGIGLIVLPGGDVRIEETMVDKLCSGEVMSLGDHRRHVLLELPHEMYFPLERLLEDLRSVGMIGILSHPERNQGILQQPEVLPPLVDRGCLMQVTANSLTGTFGTQLQQFTENLIVQGLVHFVSTDAHSPKSRRPLLRRAYDHVTRLVGEEVALDLCCRNPGCIAAGEDIPLGRVAIPREYAGNLRHGMASAGPRRRAG